MRWSPIWVALALFAACSGSSAPSPFQVDSGVDAGDAGPSGDAAGDAPDDPTLGGPCLDDVQCDDGLPCTLDHCDPALGRCRHVPDDGVCSDNTYCNGVERCDPRLGCRAGEAVTCSDFDSCTIDACVEQSQSCVHEARDADGDGDPIWNCGGGDCDDTDPLVSSMAREVCGNGRDDDCDGQIDESDCVSPLHDSCADPLLITESGRQTLSLVAAQFDYPTPCAEQGKGYRDVVLALRIPDGSPKNVDLVAHANGGSLSLARADSCGGAVGVSCAPGFDAPGGGAVSRLSLYGLAPGTYPIYLAGTLEADVELDATYSDASQPPSNETCGNALPLEPGVHATALVAGARTDLQTTCGSATGELVYSFELGEPRDVRVHAAPLDAYGVPTISLLGADCASGELTCRHALPAELFARALPAGSYFVAVSASGPSALDVWFESAEPSPEPPDQGCAAPPLLVPGQTIDIALSDHVDAENPGCLPGSVDSTHALVLDATSDVLLVERISDGDVGGLSLLGEDCVAGGVLSCDTFDHSPVRTRREGLAPGNYRALAESQLGTPVTLTAFVRPAVPPTLVAFADDCSDAFEVPESGGRFVGSTVNASADFDAGCDVGGQAPGGARDQLLHLRLSQPRRVILDMTGSDYATLLSVRAGANCPGVELPLACAAGYDGRLSPPVSPRRSFLDLSLEAGDYYLQVDGYYGDQGAWQLDVYTSPP